MKSIIRCAEAIRPPMLTRESDTPEFRKLLLFKHARNITPFMASLVARHRSIMVYETTHANIILLRKECSFASSLILEFMEFKIEDLF
jgi:hypothetical protein